MPRHHMPTSKGVIFPLGNVDAITDRMNFVPGFRTSAAFFIFLRANLVLPLSTMNSTQLLDIAAPQTFPPLFLSSLIAMSPEVEENVLTPSNPFDGIPELTTSILTTECDKIAAMKLVADSIAQQRQAAAKAIIFHPLTIMLYLGLVTTVNQLLYKTSGDMAIIVTTTVGMTMALLVAIRGITSGYLSQAEQYTWKSVMNEDGEKDTMIATKFGDEIISTVILRLERNGKGGKKRSKTGGKGIIRGWATRIRYRDKGVGTALLEEAVAVTREKLGNSAAVGFAADHANSKMILPEMFNRAFRKRETMAMKSLEEVLNRIGRNKRKR